VRRQRPVVLSVLALTVIPLGHAAAQGGLEVSVGGVSMFAHRSAQFEGAVGTGSGTMPGGEFLLRLRYLGLAGRLFGGAFAADSGIEAVGRIHAGDVRLIAGPRFIAADIGYARRAFSGAFGDRSWPFARIGLRSTLAIGASGLSAQFLVAYYAGLAGDDQRGRDSGREAETRLVYTPARLPIYAALGYRHERFTVASSQDVRPEVMGGIVVAAGVRFGR